MTGGTFDGPACPFCGAPNDAATSISGDRGPAAGDMTICLTCVQPGIFTDGAATLRRPTDEELVAFTADPDYQRAVQVVLAYHREFPS